MCSESGTYLADAAQKSEKSHDIQAEKLQLHKGGQVQVVIRRHEFIDHLYAVAITCEPHVAT